MSSFTPTPEQVACITAATADNNNLLIEARAGAAKTSTLIMIAEYLPEKNILALAFNKAIATEMTSRLPANCAAMTLSSLGYKSWSGFLRKRLTVTESKLYFLLKDWIAANVQSEELEEFYEDYEELLDSIKFAKIVGYIPDKALKLNLKSIVEEQEFLEQLSYKPSKLHQSAIDDVLTRSIEEAYTGNIDYADMLYLPTLCSSCSFPIFDVVLVDEAQDLSSLNHLMIKKLLRNQTVRLIAVGDPCQAIYGFRGAHSESMSVLQKLFNAKKLTLTVSFRCPQSVVSEALWRAPDMRYPEWAVTGCVSTLVEWDAHIFPDTAAIICRNNAPLFSLAIKLLKAGKKPELIGNNLSAFFLKLLKKIGSDDMSSSELISAIDQWKNSELIKGKKPDRINDTADCLKAFCNGAATLADVKATLKKVFESSGLIKLMTGHKAKGLEFENVYILDKHLLNLKNLQDKNLLYVMQTRSKLNLSYVDSSDFMSA
jgi:superfamily I DNA/RNA helicase